MPKRYKYQRIKIHRSYTAEETASLLSIQTNTVLKWIREEGLECDR